METYQLKHPTQCHLWQQHVEPKDLEDSFRIVTSFLEESHDIRRLVECTKCQQQYFFEFHEDAYWEDGQDRQYRTYIPVSSKDELNRLLQTDHISILNFFPRLQLDWQGSGEATIRWIR